jgi:ubiquinol oxidase
MSSINTSTLTEDSYTVDQMNAVTVAHRDTRNWSDRVAKLAARTLRIGLDFVSGYKHDKAVALNAKEGPAVAQAKYGMTEKKVGFHFAKSMQH